MIINFELELLNNLQCFWKDTLAKIGTPDDRIPQIFANLPATGDFGANQQAITELFTRLSTGNPQDDLTFILQYPVERTHIPCVSIETGAEQEDEVVGTFVYQGLNTQTQLAYQQEGGPFVKNYSLGIHSFNADTTIYLFSLVKTAILILRQTLTDSANMHFSARPVIQDAKRFGPDVVYYRYIDLNIEGIIDTAVINYKTVRNVVTANIDYPDGDTTNG